MTDQSTSASLASAAIGAMIFSVFGTGWLIVWSIKALNAGVLAWLLIASAGLALVAAAFRQYRQHRAAHAALADSPENKRASRVFNIVNIAQGVGILIAVNVTKNIGHSEWFIPSFIFIVGLHFLPLAAVFHTRRHYVTGIAMILLALLYPLLAAGGAENPVGCLGMGLILWASAISGLWSRADA